MNNIIKNRILEYVRRIRHTKEYGKAPQIPINIDGRKFDSKWLKYKDNSLLCDLFLYEKIIVVGINTTNFNKCKSLLEGYIRLHQEFLQPNGPIELKKTLNYQKH